MYRLNHRHHYWIIVEYFIIFITMVTKTFKMASDLKDRHLKLMEDSDNESYVLERILY